MSDGRPRPGCSHGPKELSTLCGTCWLELKDENAKLRREVHQLHQRSSPAAEPCACPEFCTYHARANFDSLKLQVHRLARSLGSVLTHFGRPMDPEGKSIEEAAWSLFREAAERGVFLDGDRIP